MNVVVLDTCLKELKKFPVELQKDMLFLIEQLESGVKFSMPLSRPMPIIDKGVHELRIKDKSGQYRIIYVYLNKKKTYLVHAFKKTTQATPKKNISLAKKRIRSLK